MTKILTTHQLDMIPAGEKVLAGGCFDVLHPAHSTFLKNAKKKGNILIILLESDENIKKTKGNNRPLNRQITRAENLSKLGIVDIIILLEMPTSSEYYYNLVKSLRPDIIAVTSNDPLLDIKKDQARLVQGKVVEVMKRDNRYSTTRKKKKKSNL